MLNGAQRCLTISTQKHDHKAADCKRRRVVSTAGDCSACMAKSRNLIRLIKTTAHIAPLVAPREKCVSGSIIRVQLESVLEEGRSYPCLRGHPRSHVG
jgi:hypothetical protein